MRLRVIMFCSETLAFAKGSKACRKLGYVWCVFVEPDFRAKVSNMGQSSKVKAATLSLVSHTLQGIGRQLTQRAVAYLQSLGCTRVTLHASSKGKAIYKKLGFVENNEMKFDISNTLPHIPS